MLINHLSKVLKERDQIREDDKDWVVKEAMNSRAIQHGGTFRNALSKRIDEIVTPIFSEIIATIDRNCNLDLIFSKSENFSLPISEFWLSMFRECGVIVFDYTDMITPRAVVPGIGSRKSAEDFKCEMPFSWLIYEAVQSQWNNAKSSAGIAWLSFFFFEHGYILDFLGSMHHLHRQLCEAVKATAVGEVLKTVDVSDYEDMYRRYLHDFVRLVHRCSHSRKDYETKEYEVCTKYTTKYGSLC